MKTILTAAAIAALTLTGLVRAEDAKASQEAPAKKAEVKKMNLEQLRELLERMGYEPEPAKTKEGKLVGYWVKISRAGVSLTTYVNLSPSELVIWFETHVQTFDSKEPATLNLMLTLLAEQTKLWPSYMIYFPQTKTLKMELPLWVKDVTPATLRAAFDSILDNWKILSDAYTAAKSKETAPAADPLP